MTEDLDRARETTMNKVYTGASMSLDGYIAGPNETGFEHLFQWYGAGDIEVPTANPAMSFRLTQAGADYWREVMELSGALVVGRKLFDVTNGWGGRHPMDCKVVVVTHSVPAGWEQDGESFTFVTDGIEAGIAAAREIAGDRGVGVNGGTIARQCLEAGLLDEIWVDLVPVLLGGGTPFFEAVAGAPIVLEGPYQVTEDIGVTHLRYRAAKAVAGA
jgi:dihydrofolate reductase